MLDKIKNLIKRFFLFLAIALMVLIMIDRSFFNQLGQWAHTIFSPIAIEEYVEIPILFAAGLTGVLSTISQKYGMDTEGQKEQRSKMQELNEKIKEAKMSDDEEKLKELQNQRTQMTQEMFGNLASQFKPMMYILLITIPIFGWIHYITEPNIVYAASALQMKLPFLHTVDLTGTVLFFPGWLVWYFISSLPLSQLSRKILNVGV